MSAGADTGDTALWHPMANMAEVVAGGELVLARGEGCWVIDETGRRYLDATAGLWYCHVGWGRREIASAAARQLEMLPAYSTFGDYANRPALELADRLRALAPMPGAKIFLSSGGSDGVDTAAKLCRAYWRELGQPERNVLISRDSAYHGMHGFGTALAGIPANREGYEDLIPAIVQSPRDSVSSLERTIEEVGPERVAAVFGEPVIGAGGVLPPPAGYWPAVRALCDKHGILLVADEVITAFGRVGRTFGAQRFDFIPDLAIFAKGVTSGYLPLGGVLAGERVQEPFWDGDGAWLRHGYTYSGHAAACAAALANLDIVEHEGLADRVGAVESRWRNQLDRLAGHDLVGEVRSIGLMAAVELAAPSREATPLLVAAAVAEARCRGVLTRALAGVALQLSPALIIEDDEIGLLVERLGAALDAVAVG